MLKTIHLEFKSDRDVLRESLDNGGAFTAEVLRHALDACDQLQNALSEVCSKNMRLQSTVTLLGSKYHGMRARVPTRASDLDETGVTAAHVEAWLRWKGWTFAGIASDGMAEYRCAGETHWLHSEAVPLCSPSVVNRIADVTKHPPLDILEEMAGMLLDEESNENDFQ
jgi:hypothetical protein